MNSIGEFGIYIILMANGPKHYKLPPSKAELAPTTYNQYSKATM